MSLFKDKTRWQHFGVGFVLGLLFTIITVLAAAAAAEYKDRAHGGKWEEDKDDLKLSDMTPKVNYKPSDDIAAAIKGASLSWATEKDEKEGVETPDDTTSGSEQTGGTTGGGNDDGENEGA